MTGLSLAWPSSEFNTVSYALVPIRAALGLWVHHAHIGSALVLWGCVGVALGPTGLGPTGAAFGAALGPIGAIVGLHWDLVELDSGCFGILWGCSGLVALRPTGAAFRCFGSHRGSIGIAWDLLDWFGTY